MTSLTRRKLLAIASTGATATLAGCHPLADDHRELEIRDINELPTEDGWSAEIRIGNEAHPGDNDQTFTNVTLVAYRATGASLCETPVGTVPPSETNDSGVTVELSCRDRPGILTLTADDDHCDGDTDILVVTYNTRRDVWRLCCRDRRCGEGLPPPVWQDDDAVQ